MSEKNGTVAEEQKQEVYEKRRAYDIEALKQRSIEINPERVYDRCSDKSWTYVISLARVYSLAKSRSSMSCH